MRIVLRLFAVLIAIAVGVQAFVAVFYAPVVMYGDDQILLIWGWFAPFIGLAIGALAAWAAYRSVNGMLTRCLPPAPFAWLRVLAIGAMAVAVPTVVAQLMRTQGDVEVAWSEEVRLNDGSLVVVSRQAIGNFFGRPKSRPEEWLPAEFVISTTSQSPDSRLSAWHSPLRLLVLDRDSSTNTWYLLAEPIDCGRWHDMGRPAPPYELYVHDAKGWKRTPMDAKYVGLSANLLEAPRFTGEDIFVTAKVRQARNEWGPADSRPVIRALSRC